MRGLPPHPSEVIGGGHQAGAKHVIPQTVDQHTSCQGILVTRNILRQLQPPTVCFVVRFVRKNFQELPGHHLPFTLMVTTIQKGGIHRVRLIHSGGAGGHGDIIFKPAILLYQCHHVFG